MTDSWCRSTGSLVLVTFTPKEKPIIGALVHCYSCGFTVPVAKDNLHSVNTFGPNGSSKGYGVILPPHEPVERLL